MWLKKQIWGFRASLGLLGGLESALMEWMWRRGETSVREAHVEFGSGLAYTTVMTTMARLCKKGLLKRRKVAKAYLYAPALTEHEYQEQVTHHLLQIVLNQDKNAVATLSHFVDLVGDTDQQMLDRLDQLIKEKWRALRSNE